MAEEINNNQNNTTPGQPEGHNNGKIIQINIEEEMKSSYIDW
jgi:hypothetical protein